ncbi:hypothetical protein GJ496_005005 [Pomphorhynchus laevis]|nr:hypothetical protein GJ496_005005 [Pomphorhynchus laevis]
MLNSFYKTKSVFTFYYCTKFDAASDFSLTQHDCIALKTFTDKQLTLNLELQQFLEEQLGTSETIPNYELLDSHDINKSEISKKLLEIHNENDQHFTCQNDKSDYTLPECFLFTTCEHIRSHNPYSSKDDVDIEPNCDTHSKRTTKMTRAREICADDTTAQSAASGEDVEISKILTKLEHKVRRQQRNFLADSCDSGNADIHRNATTTIQPSFTTYEDSNHSKFINCNEKNDHCKQKLKEDAFVLGTTASSLDPITAVTPQIEQGFCDSNKNAQCMMKYMHPIDTDICHPKTELFEENVVHVGRSFAKKRNILSCKSDMSSKRVRQTNSTLSTSSRSSDEDICRWNTVTQSVSESTCLNKRTGGYRQDKTNYSCYTTEELRKLQIRESNREAARRCRERRRLHIERLEEMVQNYEAKIAKLQSDNSELHKEVSRLKGYILQNMECFPATIIWKRLNGGNTLAKTDTVTHNTVGSPEVDSSKSRDCLNFDAKQLLTGSISVVGDTKSVDGTEIMNVMKDNNHSTVCAAAGSCNVPLNLSNYQAISSVESSISSDQRSNLTRGQQHKFESGTTRLNSHSAFEDNPSATTSADNADWCDRCCCKVEKEDYISRNIKKEQNCNYHHMIERDNEEALHKQCEK